mmetsp:Transcript_703/g.1018  ORF Transcript_703/g.1018 Transcript_703/m.1018 type:complete len:331 (-) Transcript_703:152-1144(-)
MSQGVNNENESSCTTTVKSSSTNNCMNTTAATDSVLEKLNLLDEACSTKEEQQQQSDLLLIECETNGVVLFKDECSSSKGKPPIHEIAFDSCATFDENLDQHRYDRKQKNKEDHEKKIELQWPHHYTSRHRASYPKQHRRWSGSMITVDEHSSSLNMNNAATTGPSALLLQQPQSQKQIVRSPWHNTDHHHQDISSSVGAGIINVISSEEDSQHQKIESSFDVSGFLRGTTASSTFLNSSCDTLDYENAKTTVEESPSSNTQQHHKEKQQKQQNQVYPAKTMPPPNTRKLSISSLFSKGSSKQNKIRSYKVHQNPSRPSYSLDQGWHAGL